MIELQLIIRVGRLPWVRDGTVTWLALALIPATLDEHLLDGSSAALHHVVEDGAVGWELILGTKGVDLGVGREGRRASWIRVRPCCPRSLTWAY